MFISKHQQAALVGQVCLKACELHRGCNSQFDSGIFHMNTFLLSGNDAVRRHGRKCQCMYVESEMCENVCMLQDATCVGISAVQMCAATHATCACSIGDAHKICQLILNGNLTHVIHFNL